MTRSERVRTCIRKYWTPEAKLLRQLTWLNLWAEIHRVLHDVKGNDGHKQRTGILVECEGMGLEIRLGNLK